jgi:hypothetical protein
MLIIGNGTPAMSALPAARTITLDPKATSRLPETRHSFGRVEFLADFDPWRSRKAGAICAVYEVRFISHAAGTPLERGVRYLLRTLNEWDVR